jgi:hypothetical protein
MRLSLEAGQPDQKQAVLLVGLLAPWLAISLLHPKLQRLPWLLLKEAQAGQLACWQAHATVTCRQAQLLPALLQGLCCQACY